MAELTNKGLLFGNIGISVRLDYAIPEAKADASAKTEFWELDVAAFLLASEQKIPDDKHAVFYNNVYSPCRSVKYSEVREPSSPGVAGSAKEKISANLASLPDSIRQVVFLAAIHNAHERQQTFSQFKGARVRVFDDDCNAEIINLNLEEEMPSDTGVEIARFCRDDERWLFVPRGEGDAAGLEFYFNKYLDGLD